MSGGHYDYAYNKINMAYEGLEADIAGSFKKMERSYNREPYSPDIEYVEYDYLSYLSDEDRILFLKKAKKLLTNLKRCSKLLRSLEWALSGDTSLESFIGKDIK